MNRDLATSALVTLAYSAYDRLLGLEPIDWAKRLDDVPEPLGRLPSVALDFRSLRATLVYQGQRRFLSTEPITDGAPQISVRFSEPRTGEPLEVFVPLNFDDDDPAEVFTRVRY